jgi:hypothetical protein
MMTKDYNKDNQCGNIKVDSLTPYNETVILKKKRGRPRKYFNNENL